MGFWTISGRAAVGFWTFRAMLLWASWSFGRCCYCFKLPNSPSCTVEIIQHALKGQKLLAQGNALGINDIHLTPCKGKSFTYRRGFSFFIRCILKLLPLQGALLIALYPGRCPGLGASALSGRAAYMSFWTISGRAGVGFLIFW